MPKRTIKIGALAALAGLCFTTASVHAQTSVATVPVGYITQTIAAASSSNSPTNSAISIPFYNSAQFAGVITSVDSATTFSCSSAVWTANQFTATPFFTRIKSGANVGRCFPITANTSTQLTLNPQGSADKQAYDLTTLLSVGDTFEVFPANTLGSLFGLNGGPFFTGKTASVADNVYLWNITKGTWDVYFNNGTHWRSASSNLNQDTVILYPEEGLYIVHRDTANPLTLTFLGTVPSTAERTDVPGPGSVCIASRFPTDTTIGAVGLQNLPNWQSGTTANKADDVYVWNATKNTWDVCFYNGTHWRSASSNLNVENSEIIPAGSSLYFVRQSSATGGASTLVQSLPYSLN